MKTVAWYGHTRRFVEAWRVLDLSGMTPHPRASRNAVKGKQVFINGNQIHTLRDKIEVGAISNIEIKFPNGTSISEDIFLIHKQSHIQNPRPPLERTEFRKS